MVIDCDGVLTDNRVWVNENGSESVAFSRADGLAFNALHKLKVKTVIMSTEANKVVDQRGKKLKVDVLQNVTCKKSALQSLIEDHNLRAKDVVYVGNDVNDFHAMIMCGTSFCPNDAHQLIKKNATFSLSTNGGHGVIREILETHFNINLLKTLY
jgi:3-deoxy-D-manno-octulosonate 8-phosphate phosphatase (KDO 8-P phosphatase)